MMTHRRTKHEWRKRLALSLALLLCAAGASARSPQQDSREDDYRARIPLGAEGFTVGAKRRNLYILGTAHSAAFEGLRVVNSGRNRMATSAEGAKVKFFPRAISFRVTATTMTPELLEIQRDALDIADNDLNQFLLNLSFRLKIFHGLQVTSLEPEAVEVIGMPASVPYEERTWRASFTLPAEVPIDDRVVLEVLRPDGQRLCKFHLEF